MNIIFEGLSTLQPADFDFVHAGFLIGQRDGDFPAYRNGPDNEEMVVLATDGDDMLGFATFYHAGDPERIWLDLLWVPVPHRRKSVGTRLLAAVVAYGERHGLAVEFGTSAGNTGMQALAESFGLQPFSIGYRKEPVAA